MADSFGEDLSGYERVGVVYPVYFWGVPLIVKRFIESLDAQNAKGAYFFAVATYGGNAGNGLRETSSLLWKHRLSLDYGALVKMGGNYILLYEKMKKSERINEQAEETIRKAAADIKAKKRLPVKKENPVFRALISDPFRKRVHLEAAKFIVDSSCTSCGSCARLCPVANIEMEEGKPVFGDRCEQCMACIQWCPVEAINGGEKTKGRMRYRHPCVTAEDLSRKH
jgi:ferredoxin